MKVEDRTSATWSPYEDSSCSLCDNCLPHRRFFFVGDNESLFVWGHPSLVDETSPKVVAGEGEMDSRAHSTA